MGVRVMSDELKITDLMQLQLFHGERHEALERLLAVASLRTLKMGTVLLEPECENRCLYLVLSGLLRVELEADQRTFITHIHKGECVGELSVLDGKPTTARVTASDTCHLLVIDQDDVWSLIPHSPALVRNLLLLLTQRIRKNDEALCHSFTIQQQYARSARIDALTGLYNRHWLDEVLPRMIKRADIAGTDIGLMMLDVDHFKQFNDTYGHQAGDEVLREVGAIIRAHLRADDSAARYGGEEFVVLLPGLGYEDVLDVAERMREVIYRQTCERLGSQGWKGVTISIGLAMRHAEQAEHELIAKADAALYQAKDQGRNRVVGEGCY